MSASITPPPRPLEDLESFLAAPPLVSSLVPSLVPVVEPTKAHLRTSSSFSASSSSSSEADAVPALLPSPPPTPLFCPIVCSVGVVGFDHSIGAILEYIFPPLPGPESAGAGIVLPDEWRFLPSLALPDGCHHLPEDSCYFSVPALGFGRNGGPSTLYGVSMFRQVRPMTAGGDPLAEQKGQPGAVRNRIQKAIVVLSSAPMYGAIQARLWGISHAYFSQGLVEENGFANYHVLDQFHASLTSTLGSSGMHEENLYLGFSPRKLVLGFGASTLTLFKALLLEKRVLFTGLPASHLCTALLTVISLMPGLFSLPFQIGPSSASERQNQQRLFSSFGLPLRCLVKQAVLPYVCLQQMDDLAALSSFFAASSNPLFQRALPPGAVLILVDVEQHALAILDHAVTPLLTLSAPDRRFIGDIIAAVAQFEIHPSGYVGSDDWVRREFQRYLCCFLGAASTIPSIFEPSFLGPGPGPVLDAVADFDLDFVNAWFRTFNFLQWRSDAKPKLLLRRIQAEPSLSAHHPAHHRSGYYDSAAAYLNKVKDLGWGGWF